MKNASTISLISAEQEIEEGNEAVLSALEQLNDKVNEGLKVAHKIGKVTKNPFALAAIAGVIGIFFGQMIRLSFYLEAQSHE